MEAALLFLKAAVRIVGGVRAAIFLALLLVTLAGAKYWQHRAEKAEYAAKVCEVARAVQIGIWKGEIDRLTRDLADAEKAGQKAIADKAQAEKASALRLAAERKNWERIYGSKPENRKWADSPLPADVASRLRDHGG